MENLEKTHFIDLLSKYQMQVNKLIYVSKIGSYLAMAFEKFDIATMEKLIFELLVERICFTETFIEEEVIDNTEQAIRHYKNAGCFNFKTYDGIGLTALGGQIWEEQFSPNWRNYVECSYNDNSIANPMTLEITCQNLDLLQQIIAPLSLANFNQYTQITNDFHPCYWKKIHGKVYHFSYTATSWQEKLCAENVFESIHQYSPLFSTSKNF